MGTTGARAVTSQGEGAVVVDAAGNRWSVGGVAAWDAQGEPLAAWTETRGTTPRFHVDASGATWPVTVDPMYTTASWKLLTGTTTSFGVATAAAGDVDGDGYADVFVAAPDVGDDTGQVWVFHGSAAGLSDTATTVLYGVDPGDDFGTNVAGVGDVDGDGYDDVAVTTNESSGRVYIYPGGPTGVSTSADTTLKGSGYYGFGAAVVHGDVDGDGYDDVVAGAPGTTSYGTVHLFLGSSAGVSTTAAQSFTSPSTGISYGEALALGDWDADGDLDLAVAAPDYYSSTGRVYVYENTGGSFDTTATTITGAGTGYDFGTFLLACDVDGDADDDLLAFASYDPKGDEGVYEGDPGGLSTTASTNVRGAVSSFGTGLDCGDVDADGYDDLIGGASGYSVSSGALLAYIGSASGLPATPDTTITTRGDTWGDEVHVVGDLDGDGYDDVLVSDSTYDSAGRVTWVGGGAAGLGAATAGEIDSPVPLAEDLRVAGLGDVNGDGYADVVVSAYSYSRGALWVFHGSASGTEADAATALFGSDYSSSSTGAFGLAFDGAGDVDADGYDDVVVGDYKYNTSRGSAYVFHGAATGLSTSPSFTVTGSSGGWYGYAVAGAGDVNGDGYGDVIVGMPDASYGYAKVYHGSASGLSTTAATSMTGPAMSSSLGTTVAGGGDVNGDGYDDVLAGAPDYGTYGVVQLYLGSASGVPSTPDAQLFGGGSTTGSYFAEHVAFAGDVDGDGYDAVALSCPGYSSMKGRVNIHLGGSGGVSTSADITLEGDASYDRFGDMVAGAGDVDGDGYDDIVVGVPEESYAEVYLVPIRECKIVG